MVGLLLALVSFARKPRSHDLLNQGVRAGCRNRLSPSFRFPTHAAEIQPSWPAKDSHSTTLAFFNFQLRKMLTKIAVCAVSLDAFNTALMLVGIVGSSSDFLDAGFVVVVRLTP